ncbi:hypothetical protein GCM10027040_17210 [Halomonas shantousis]
MRTSLAAVFAVLTTVAATGTATAATLSQGTFSQSAPSQIMIEQDSSTAFVDVHQPLIPTAHLNAAKVDMSQGASSSLKPHKTGNAIVQAFEHVNEPLLAIEPIMQSRFE